MWRVFNQAQRNWAVRKLIEQKMNTARRSRKKVPGESLSEVPSGSKERSQLTGTAIQIVHDANLEDGTPASAVPIPPLDNGYPYSVPIQPISVPLNAASSVIRSALTGINLRGENAQRSQITESHMKRVKSSRNVLGQRNAEVSHVLSTQLPSVNCASQVLAPPARPQPAPLLPSFRCNGRSQKGNKQAIVTSHSDTLPTATPENPGTRSGRRVLTFDSGSSEHSGDPSHDSVGSDDNLEDIEAQIRALNARKRKVRATLGARK